MQILTLQEIKYCFITIYEELRYAIHISTGTTTKNKGKELETVLLYTSVFRICLYIYYI